MKKLVVFLVFFVCIFSIAACNATISESRYDEISTYVLDHISTLSDDSNNKDLEFFVYEAVGLAIGGTDYGYYYTANNEIAVPDYYSGDKLGEKREADGGTYFGKPNDGTDWCYIKQITDHWFYFELHWA